MSVIERKIVEEPNGLFTWYLGHDSLVRFNLDEDDSNICDKCSRNVIFPVSVDGDLARYEHVRGNLSVADLVMRGEMFSDLAHGLVELGVFGFIEGAKEPVDEPYQLDLSTLKRVKNHYSSLKKSGSQLPSKSLQLVADFLEGESKVCASDELNAKDVTVGLGRIVTDSAQRSLSILGPPDGVSTNSFHHLGRVIGELFIFTSLYQLSDKRKQVSSCAEIFNVLQQYGAMSQEVVPHAVLAILDHGRRRLRGPQPPKNVDIVCVVLAAALLNNGIDSLERLIDE